MRQLVYASLPLGKGVVLDPFMGAGTTLAAAESVGYSCIGVERYRTYYDLAKKTVPQLAGLKTNGKSSVIVAEGQIDMLA